MDLFTFMVVLLLVPLSTTLVVAQQQLLSHDFKLKPPLTTTTVFLSHVVVTAHVSTCFTCRLMATGGTANGEPLAGAQTVPATTGQPHLAVQDLKALVSLLAARMVRGGRGDG